MVNPVGQKRKGPKCNGNHPKVVGYVCPHCGAGSTKVPGQSPSGPKRAVVKAGSAFKGLGLPLRVIGNKLAK